MDKYLLRLIILTHSLTLLNRHQQVLIMSVYQSGCTWSPLTEHVKKFAQTVNSLNFTVFQCQAWIPSTHRLHYIRYVFMLREGLHHTLAKPYPFAPNNSTCLNQMSLWCWKFYLNVLHDGTKYWHHLPLVCTITQNKHHCLHFLD